VLAQNRPNHVITSITHNFKGKSQIGRLNDGGGNESLFDPIKSLKTLNKNDEWGIFGERKVRGLAVFEKSLMKS